MAKLLLALCLLSCFVVIALANTSGSFTIQGRVYCDTCRAGFETSATEYVEGAKVKVECKNYTTGETTQEADGVTDASGTYNIPIMRNHEIEICEVALISSSRKDCDEIKPDRQSARVILAHDTGIASDIRYANSLGFLKKEPLPACGSLLQIYALADDLD
ncbi:uncharacterized protein A4U43_C08F160 [Asparagus officinalis]|uniref:pollen-specific protein C13-like n=1 Tax=Asparagus officinalis TaxID=4686 RepID=UPI00098E0103|nr:pollen-specific protein C13-like [Asparagus officinalis]ONK58828.1 uncharacterized protein A4U43_C08F160 [Asparagus officinalis]